MAEENKVRFGLSNLTIFFRGEDTEQGAPTWGQPIKIPGVTQCSRTAQVNSNDFYADNVLYWRGNADTGDEITVTTAFFPDAVKAQMLGWKVDTKGALVRTTDGNPKEFAMAYQVEGDQKPRAKVVYSCIASVPNETSSTKGENIEVQTEEMSIRSKAIVVNGHESVDAVLNKSDDAAAFATFFNVVYVPEYGETGETGETGVSGA